MDKYRIGSLIVILSLLFNFTAHAVPDYIESTPLASLIDTPVGVVKSGALQVPFITWGGDIPTIFANGNKKNTQKESLFSKAGLQITLKREDSFTSQLESYLRGDSPFLRGTLGMINLASDLLSKDPRTKPIVIYQLSWSAGGDALVVSKGIKKAVDLRGKRIALQAYGPHVSYLNKVLHDANLSIKDVNIRWLADLTATDNSPMAALQAGDVDAAFVVIPDALALTSGGIVGSGAEDSVKGAKILLSTKTANRVIADVYAVRGDYYAEHRDRVQSFVHQLYKADEQFSELFKNKKKRAEEYQQVISASAQLLLDSSQAVGDTEGLYLDAELVGFGGNVNFLSSQTYPRRLGVLNQELTNGFKAAKLLRESHGVDAANWDFAKFKPGLANTSGVELPTFIPERVASLVAKRQQLGNLDDGTLFQFEVYFQPNQNAFSLDLYAESFTKVIDLATTYGGAIITVEGHSDPMGYLRKQKNGESALVLGRIKQSAKNLSLSRAVSVRDSVTKLATSKGIYLDPSQFAILGYGIAKPASGVCGNNPCAPKTREEWLSNMRVVFRIIQVEAESSVFQPL